MRASSCHYHFPIPLACMNVYALQRTLALPRVRQLKFSAVLTYIEDTRNRNMVRTTITYFQSPSRLHSITLIFCHFLPPNMSMLKFHVSFFNASQLHLNEGWANDKGKKLVKC